MTIGKLSKPERHRPVFGRNFVIVMLLTGAVVARPVWRKCASLGRSEGGFQSAKTYLPSVSQNVKGDPRFNAVTVGLSVYGNAKWGIDLHGTVGNAADLAALKAIVSRTASHSNVFVDIKIRPRTEQQFADSSADGN